MDEWVTVSFEGNASKVLGSPYIGFKDRYDAQFNISAQNIERYLEDVVISTLSLDWSTNDGDIEALTGAETFVFNKKVYFYVPYGACLLATTGIYALGIWSLFRNGSSAGNSFFQLVTTTSVSKNLRASGAECSMGGGENVPKKLRNLELRFGVFLPEYGDGDVEERIGAQAYGFGTKDELADL
jgi:hypothetical protein